MSKIIQLERPLDKVQTALLMSLKSNNFEEFKRILQRPTIEESCTSSCLCTDAIDINHLYGDPENKTLLDIACSSTNRAAFVKYLLQHGADVNLINCTHGAAPIHLAVSNSDFDTVKLLVEHKDINIHQPNTEGLTAFHLAAKCRRNDFIILLQERQAVEIEQAKIKVRLNKRKFAKYKHDGYEETNLVQTLKMDGSSGNDQSLSSLLKCKNYEAFKSKANVDNIRFIDDSLGFTYLQYACKFGLIEFVELLLDLEVDPNQIGINCMTPIILAAYEGYYDIVQLLQNTGIVTYDPVYEKNILHFILCGYEDLIKHTAERLALTEWLGPVNLDDAGKKDHEKCLELILDNVPHHQLNVDEWDERGNAPLYYAIKYDNRGMILSLVERGASIGAPNRNGDLPITLIKPATLEYLLDESMWTTAYWNDYNRIIFNYNWLTCRDQCFNNQQINEMDLLKAVSEVSHLKPLLIHPFFLVLLDFKWHVIVKKLFYINLCFYILLVAIFSLNVVIISYINSVDENSGLIELIILYASFSWYVIITCNTFMLLKQFTQFIIYSKRNKYAYVSDPKNYMEITVIIIVYALSFREIQSFKIINLLFAIAFFFSYLITLNHPLMSIQIEMFKVVALNTFKFLMSFVILILAFAFTFHILFMSVKSTENSFNYFRGILNATFKTLIMSTGEYEITNTLINDNYGIGHLVFILFIFFINIVLFNLLNAIAVSDIQSIRKEAELVSTVARIQLIMDTQETISTLYSLLDFFVQLVSYCTHNAMSRRPSRTITWEKQCYYTNYFNSISNCREIIYEAKLRERGTITKKTFDGKSVFVASPSTERSIREKISAKTSKEEIANVTRVSETSHEVYQSLITLINALDKKYQIVQPKLIQHITRLSSQKLK